MTGASTLPFSWYVDEEQLRRERARIFATSWQYAGRVADVAASNSFLAVDAGGVPILVTRDEAGHLRCLRERLSPSRRCAHGGVWTPEHRAVRLPRLDLWSGRCPAGRPAVRPGARLRPGRLVAPSGERRGMGAVSLRQSGLRLRPARRPPRRPPRAAGARDRSRRARLPFAGRISGRVPTGRSWSRTSSSATTARPRIQASATRSTCTPTATCSRRIPPSARSSAGRSRATSAGSSTCSIRTPASTCSPGLRICRSGRSHPRARPARSATWTTSSRRGSTRTG